MALSIKILHNLQQAGSSRWWGIKIYRLHLDPLFVTLGDSNTSYPFIIADSTSPANLPQKIQMSHV